MYSDYFEKTFEKWKATGLLEGLDDYKAHHISMMLENQLIFKHYDYKGDSIREKLWERLRIPLVRRVYGDLCLWDMISIQAMPSSTSTNMSCRDKYGAIKQHEAVAKTRQLKNYIPIIRDIENQEGEEEFIVVEKWGELFVEGEYAASIKEKEISPIEGEVSLLDYVSSQLTMEITHEVFRDLRNNVKYSSKDWKSPENLVDSILIQAETVTRNIGRAANWLVTSPEIVMEIIKSEKLSVVADYKSDFKKIQFVGNLSKLRIYVDPKSPTDEILMGYKGDAFAASYFYLPFIPFTEILQDGKVGRYRLIGRGDKKMPSDDYYTGIVLNNYSYINGEEG